MARIEIEDVELEADNDEEFESLKAPYPWFGGKSRAAGLIWSRIGSVKNYVEPFAGSLAVLLNRPTVPQIETVNDLDCYLANFWRAIAAELGEGGVEGARRLWFAAS